MVTSTKNFFVPVCIEAVVIGSRNYEKHLKKDGTRRFDNIDEAEKDM
jgi:hypothetical protein